MPVGRTAAVLASVLVSSQRHRLDPFVYLRDVLTRLPEHPADRLEELLPDRWAPSPQVAAADSTASDATSSAPQSPSGAPAGIPDA
jgi:hypothetical protein